MLEWEGIHDENDIANILRIANELPNLQNQVQQLKYQNQKLERHLQVRRRQIGDLTEVENMHHQNGDTLQNDIDGLLNERRQLRQFVLRFNQSSIFYSMLLPIFPILLIESLHH